MGKIVRPLLVVDGYNVLHKSARYTQRIQSKSSDIYCQDPFVLARDLLISDVASYAQGSYDAIVVFDGGNNISSNRPVLHTAGITVMFSREKQSADSVIERIVTEARAQERKIIVVTSDNTIRSVVGTGYVACVSADTFLKNITTCVSSMHKDAQEQTYTKLTLQDRLSPEMRDRLNKMIGRS